jgi:hypothetical protein
MSKPTRAGVVCPAGWKGSSDPTIKPDPDASKVTGRGVALADRLALVTQCGKQAYFAAAFGGKQ